MSGEASGSRSRARSSISSAICEAGHALAHQRLVHVDVEQAHLGVGDLGERLPVHAQSWRKATSGKPASSTEADVVERLHVLVGELLEPRAGAGRSLVQKRSISAGSRPVSSATSLSEWRSRAAGKRSSTKP